jgi:membrane-associated phospholipid phosphatase
MVSAREEIPYRPLSTRVIEIYTAMEKVLGEKFHEEIGDLAKPQAWPSVVFWVIVSACFIGAAFELDQWVDGYVEAHRNADSSNVAKEVSFFGDFFGVLLVGLTCWGVARWRRLSRLETLFKVMVCAAIVSGACANFCRCVTGRTRPNAKVEAGWYGPSKGAGFGEAHKFQAFPSAHTAVVTGFFAPLLIAAYRRRFSARSLAFGAVAFAGVGLMAWARVWVGAHRFSDVIAAVILGGSVAILMSRNSDYSLD